MSRPDVLPARPLLAPLRQMDSAQTSMRRLVDGRLLLTIRHAPLLEVTPAMLAWWFANIEGEIEIDGVRYPRYLIWHPYDHISYSSTRLRDGSIGPGVRFTIVEAFGASRSLLVRTRDHVDLLDETGLRLSARKMGIEVFSLHHRFTNEGDGTQYDSTMIFGLPGRLGRIVNPLLTRRLFSERHGQAWLRHNIEEVGLLDHLVPRLYAERDRVAPG